MYPAGPYSAPQFRSDRFDSRGLRRLGENHKFIYLYSVTTGAGILRPLLPVLVGGNTGFGGNLGGSTGRAARVGEERGHGFFGNLGQHMLGGGGSTEAG